MKKGKVTKCTPGLYITKGTKGVRIGQSMCAETRVRRVLREQEKCIGRVKKVVIIPVNNREQRLKLERLLIEVLNPKCNPVKR